MNPPPGTPDDPVFHAIGDIIHDTAARLGGHVDSVIIIASVRDSNGVTRRACSWDGDTYAAYGLAKAFVRGCEKQMLKGRL